MIRFCSIVVMSMSMVCQASLADDIGLERLESARARWLAAQSGNYRYSYQKYCDCYRGEPPTTVVTVRNGRIDEVFHVHSDSDRQVPARDGSVDLYWTVEDLFGKLAAAYAREAVVRVEYDSSQGYPVSLYIDYDPAFSGDETDLRLSAFERF